MIVVVELVAVMVVVVAVEVCFVVVSCSGSRGVFCWC